MKLRYVLAVIAVLAPRAVFATPDPQADAALSAYYQSPRAPADLLQLCETLGRLEAGIPPPLDPHDGPFVAANWATNKELYQRLKAAGQAAGQACARGDFAFQSQDWQALSRGWSRVPECVRGAPLDLQKQDVDRLFALLSALRQSNVDLSKVARNARPLICDGEKIGPLGRRIVDGNASPAVSQSLINRVDAIARDPRHAREQLDELFVDDPQTYQELAQAVVAGHQEQRGVPGPGVVLQKPKVVKLDGGVVPSAPGETTESPVGPVFSGDRLLVGESLLTMITQSPVSPRLGATTLAANREIALLERRRLAQERADLLLADLRALTGSPQAAKLLDRYRLIAQAPQERRLGLLERWERDAWAVTVAQGGSEAAREKDLLQGYAKAMAGKDQVAIDEAQERLRTFFAEHPARGQYYADRLAYQQRNLKLAESGELPVGTVLRPEDLGYGGSPQARIKISVVDGRRGLLFYDPAAKDASQRFESFDHRLVRESKRTPEGWTFTRTQRVDEKGQAFVENSFYDPKTKIEQQGDFDARGAFAPRREYLDGRLTRVWLADFRTGPTAEEPLIQTGLVTRSEARPLAGYSRFVLSQDSSIVEAPSLQKGQDGRALLTYRVGTGAGAVFHVVTVRPGSFVLVDLVVTPDNKVASGVNCYFDVANNRCARLEIFTPATYKAWDPDAHAGWGINAKTGMSYEEKGAYVQKESVKIVVKDWDGQGWRLTSTREPKDDNFMDVVTKQLGHDVSAVLAPVAVVTNFVANRGTDFGHFVQAGVTYAPLSPRFDRLSYRDCTLYQSPVMQHFEDRGARLMAKLKADLGADYDAFRSLMLDRYREAALKGAEDVEQAVGASGAFDAPDEGLGRFLISGQAGCGASGAGHEFARRAQRSRSILGTAGNFSVATFADGAELAPQVLAFEGLGTIGGLIGRAGELGELEEGARTVQTVSGWARTGRVIAQTSRLASSAYFKTMMVQQGLQLFSAHNENLYDNFAELAALALLPGGDHKRKTGLLDFDLRKTVTETLTTSPIGNLVGSVRKAFQPKPIGVVTGTQLELPFMNEESPQMNLFGEKGGGPRRVVEANAIARTETPVSPDQLPLFTPPQEQLPLPLEFPQTEDQPIKDLGRNAALAQEQTQNQTPKQTAPQPNGSSGLGWLQRKVQAVRDLFRGQPTPQEIERSNQQVIAGAMDELRRENPGVGKAYDRIPLNAKKAAGVLGPQARLIRVLSLRGVNLICEGEVMENGAPRRVVLKILADAPGDAADGYRNRLERFKLEAQANRKMAELLPPGWAPRVLDGYFDVGGNPAFAMEMVPGKDVASLTAEEAALITDARIKDAMAGLEILRRAGLVGIDSPQLMMGPDGRLVFIDAVNTTDEGGNSAQTPQDLATQLLVIKESRAMGTLAPERIQELIGQVKSDPRFQTPDIDGYAHNLPPNLPPPEALASLQAAPSVNPSGFRGDRVVDLAGGQAVLVGGGSRGTEVLLRLDQATGRTVVEYGDRQVSAEPGVRIRVGRDPSSSLVVDDPTFSRRQFEVVGLPDGRVLVRDVSSYGSALSAEPTPPPLTPTPMARGRRESFQVPDKSQLAVRLPGAHGKASYLRLNRDGAGWSVDFEGRTYGVHPPETLRVGRGPPPRLGPGERYLKDFAPGPGGVLVTVEFGPDGRVSVLSGTPEAMEVSQPLRVSSHIEGRQSNILGRLFSTDGGEIIRGDVETDPELPRIYGEVEPGPLLDWLKEPRNKRELALLGNVFDVVKREVPYDSDRADELEARNNVTMLAGEANLGGRKGVCRHQALAVATLLDALRAKGYLEGQVHYVVGGVHAWVEYVTPEGRSYILDVAQRAAPRPGDPNFKTGVIAAEGATFDGKDPTSGTGKDLASYRDQVYRYTDFQFDAQKGKPSPRTIAAGAPGLLARATNAVKDWMSATQTPGEPPAVVVEKSIRESPQLPEGLKVEALSGRPGALESAVHVQQVSSQLRDGIVQRFGLPKTKVDALMKTALEGFPLAGYHGAAHPLEVAAKMLESGASLPDVIAALCHDSVGALRVPIEGGDGVARPPAVSVTTKLWLARPEVQAALRDLGLSQRDVSDLGLLIDHTFYSDTPREIREWSEDLEARLQQRFNPHDYPDPAQRQKALDAFRARAARLADYDKAATYFGEPDAVMRRIYGLKVEQGKSVIGIFNGTAWFLKNVLARDEGFQRHLRDLSAQDQANFASSVELAARFEGVRALADELRKSGPNGGPPAFEVAEQRVHQFFEERGIPPTPWLEEAMAREISSGYQPPTEAQLIGEFRDYLPRARALGAKTIPQAVDLYLETFGMLGSELKPQMRQKILKAVPEEAGGPPAPGARPRVVAGAVAPEIARSPGLAKSLDRLETLIPRELLERPGRVAELRRQIDEARKAGRGFQPQALELLGRYNQALPPAERLDLSSERAFEASLDWSLRSRESGASRAFPFPVGPKARAAARAVRDALVALRPQLAGPKRHLARVIGVLVMRDGTTYVAFSGRPESLATVLGGVENDLAARLNSRGGPLRFQVLPVNTPAPDGMRDVPAQGGDKTFCAEKKLFSVLRRDPGLAAQVAEWDILWRDKDEPSDYGTPYFPYDMQPCKHCIANAGVIVGAAALQPVR